jgi:hypothetical protein
MFIKKMKSLPFGIITLLLLNSCFNSPLEMSYNESSHIIKITDQYDVSQKGVAKKIFDKFKTEPLVNLFDQNAIFFSQLYYLSFSGEFDLYGVPYYDSNFSLFSSSNDNFLLSPIRIYTFHYKENEYFLLYSTKSTYVENSEEYRPNIEVFQLKQNTFYQIDNFSEHFSVNGRVTSEWSAINDFFSGKVNSIFRYLDELTFLTNEIILSLAFVHYTDIIFNNIRLIARFMSTSTLGVEFDYDKRILTYDRKSERRCSPSLSNCESIYTLPSSHHSFDFNSLEYVYGEFNGSNYTKTEFNLNYSLNINFSTELVVNLLQQKTAQDFATSLNQIYSQYSFSPRDKIKLFFLNF